MEASVIVLGGGFAGLAALDELTARGIDGLSVTLIDRRPHATFSPLLPDAISQRVLPRRMLHPLAPHCARRGAEFVQAEAREIRTEECAVETDRGTFQADALLLCLGCENDYFGNEAARRRAIGLKSVAEAMAIRHRVLEAAGRSGSKPHFVVVGGGYTGFETASHVAYLLRHATGRSYAELAESHPVTVVDVADQVLGNVSDRVRKWARRLIEGFGIDVRTGCTVDEFTEDGVVLTDGTELARALVLWSAGVTPVPACAALDVEKVRGGRLAVDEFLRLAGSERVFAAGDVAGAEGPGGDGALRLAVQFSLSGGRRAAGNALAAIRGEPLRPYRPTDLGYVVPLSPGKGAGVVLGRELAGRTPSWLHYFMCAYRSWGWGDRLGIAWDLISGGEVA